MSGVARTHCRDGHPFAGDNLRVMANGTRRCRSCMAGTRRDERAGKRRGRPPREAPGITHGPAGVTAAVSCWCEESVVLIPVEQVGRTTGTCGEPYCHAPVAS